MNFDNFSSNSSNNYYKNNKRSNIKLAIVIGGAILLGIIVYYISSLIFSPKPQVNNNQQNTTTDTSVELSIKNTDVVTLYNYVNYKSSVNNDIFLRSPSIKYENFSNYDKFYYCTQFIKDEDLTEIKSTDTNNKIKLYSISDKKINEYMKKFFGKKIEYEKEIEMNITLPIEKDQMNSGTIKYDPSKKYYILSLNTNNKKIESSNSYITDVSKAFKNDGKLVIEEKIIYIDIKEQNNKYNIKVYKDYNHTMLLDEKNNIDKNGFELKSLINEYLDSASVITYTFKLNNNDQYYFESSKIDIN